MCESAGVGTAPPLLRVPDVRGGVGGKAQATRDSPLMDLTHPSPPSHLSLRCRPSLHGHYNSASFSPPGP